MEMLTDTSLQYATSFPSLFNGGVSRLRSIIESNPKLRLIVIDTLAAFIGGASGGARGENAFQADYRMMRPLLDLVKGLPVTLLVVQHGRKDVPGGNSDPFDSVAGTLGTSAVADTLMVLYEQREPSCGRSGKTTNDQAADRERREGALQRIPAAHVKVRFV